MVRPRHPKKEIEVALDYAEQHNWRIVKVDRGHAWCRLYCPYNDKECRCGAFCVISVWSTPKVPHDMAERIYHVVDKCNSAKRPKMKKE